MSNNLVSAMKELNVILKKHELGYMDSIACLMALINGVVADAPIQKKQYLIYSIKNTKWGK